MPGGNEGARRDAGASARPRSRPRRTGLDRAIRASIGKAHRCTSSGSYASPTRRCTDGSAQLLQTHAHAMQSIQDQQNTLIGAVLPLVPVLHGVPPQMDQIKVMLSDMVANAVSTMTNSVESVRSTLVAEFAHRQGRVGSSTRVASSSKSISSSRRKRSDASVLGAQGANVPASSPLDGRGHGGRQLSHKRARIEGPTHRSGNVQLPRKLSRLPVPLTSSGDPPPLLRTPQTPRQPLADLLVFPDSNPPRIQHRTASHVNSTSRGYMRPRETLWGAGGPFANAPPISRSPLRPLGHTRSSSEDQTITGRRSAGLPSAVGSSDQDALSKAIKIEEILEPNLTGVFSIHSSPLSSPPSSMPLAARHDPNEMNANTAQPSARQRSRPRDDMPDAPQVELVQVPPSSDPFSNPDASPAKSMSLRDRRAQISRVSQKRVQIIRRDIFFCSLGAQKLDASFRWCLGRMRKNDR